LDDKIGYMIISEFDGETENEFDEAMKDLEKQGMKAIVFDLRTNPGGLVDSVTDILDKILPEGVTVYMIDKDGKKEEFKSDAKHHFDIPITVLTSSSTASSAEIFSGAIRDFKYGTIIGEKTYGKGIVQRTIPLADGSAVKLTVETYYTPSGACIHGEGITPDIELEYEYSGDTEAEEYDYLADNQILKAMEVLEEELNK
ncbi:MAG: S41 family peptidase, partial [Lachnospiraceae bacterium]|nr:S41 family peptidase [Lachnospiraceae bacterium]